MVADRFPPYSVRIYAAGFDQKSNFLLKESDPKWPLGANGKLKGIAVADEGGGSNDEDDRQENDNRDEHEDGGGGADGGSGGGGGLRSSGGDELREWDALTTFGVRVWRPDVQAWREVSVMGSVHEPRTELPNPGKHYPDLVRSLFGT